MVLLIFIASKALKPNPFFKTREKAELPYTFGCMLVYFHFFYNNLQLQFMNCQF